MEKEYEPMEWEPVDVNAAWEDTIRENIPPRRDPDSIDYPEMSLEECQEILDIVLKEYSHDEITWDILSKHATFYMAKRTYREDHGKDSIPSGIEFGNTIYDNWL